MSGGIESESTDLKWKPVAEPTVQVSVSLIEQAPHGETCQCAQPEDMTGVCDCWKSEALSQPTPTADPMRAAQSDGGDRLIEFAEHVLGVPLDPWQMRLCRRVFGGNIGRSTGRPDVAPPSIADMVPGTELSIVERWTVAVDGTGEKFIHRAKRFARFADDVDPSTIRDVTPPKDATS